MTESRLLMAVDDDDESLRELLRQFGFAARAFSSAAEFVVSEVLSNTARLILDIAMQGMSSPDLQRESKRLSSHIPIVFITGQTDETCAPVRLRREGGMPLQTIQ